MYRPYRENPSFSSSLLDEIYRSIDQRDDQEVTVFQKTTRNKQNSFCADHRETVLFDKWVEPVTCKKGVTRKQSPPDFKTSYNSSSSSSDSSCGGGFSSSETESVYGFSSKPKPIRTTTDRHDKYSYSYNTREKDKQCNYNKHNQKYEFDDFQAKQKHEGKFVKTKSRAMKIYGDLKKVKQPISPGGRLATFLNSIFATNNTKNTTKIPQSFESKSANASTTTCSSASSYSRSCLSKTPSSSSRGKLNTNTKRSVRFYLDTEPSCDIFGGLKQDYNKNDNKARQVEEAARNLLRNYQKKVEYEFELSSNNVKSYNVIDMKYENDDEDEDDDVASHASSDLFELENLSAIGMGQYGDELPVYETTHLDMNLAIGNGFLM